MSTTNLAVCCAPVLEATLDTGEAENLAGMFKVLGDPIRLRLLSLVANGPDGEACVCELVDAAGRSQPTVSHHLSLLTEAGLLTREKRGRWAYYRVEADRVLALRDALSLGA